MLPDRVSNPGPLTYESGALPTALRGPALSRKMRTTFGHSEQGTLFLQFKDVFLLFLFFQNILKHLGLSYKTDNLWDCLGR